MTETVSIAPAESDLLRLAAFRPVTALIAAFLIVSLMMELFLATVTALGFGIDIAVWIRCSIVLGSSLLLLVFTRSAAKGSRSAWIRLRIVSPIIVAAVVVIVSIPGFLPDWVRVEQAVCGLLVLPAAIMVNLPRVVAHFRKK